MPFPDLCALKERDTSVTKVTRKRQDGNRQGLKIGDIYLLYPNGEGEGNESRRSGAAKYCTMRNTNSNLNQPTYN
jgi:hypothetical protein